MASVGNGDIPPALESKEDAPPPFLTSLTTDQKVPPKSEDCETTFFTPEELKKFDGKGPDGRVLLALSGKVFDVTPAKNMYGPGGPYDCYAGRDATVGLATFSLVTSRIEDENFQLEERHRKNLENWEKLYESKYTQIGYLRKEPRKPPKPSKSCFIV